MTFFFRDRDLVHKMLFLHSAHPLTISMVSIRYNVPVIPKCFVAMSYWLIGSKSKHSSLQVAYFLALAK